MSLDLSLVDKVVDPTTFSIDPTLSLKSKEWVLILTLPLKSEVKVVELMSPQPDPNLSSESVKTDVVSLTKSSSCPSLLIESKNHPDEVFIVSSDCSMQEEVLSLSTEPSPSSEVISFD